jgi:hypothetical protein
MGRQHSKNFFHAYVDNPYDRTIGLYLDNASSPTWKLGLKTSPSSIVTPPNQGYAYGNNGSVGMYATTDSAFIMNYVNGFWVSHKGANLLNIDRTEGSFFYNEVASVPALVVRGAVTQSANLQEWRQSDGAVLSYVNSVGAIKVPTIYFNDGTSQTTGSSLDQKANKSVSADETLLIADCIVFVNSSSESIELTLPTAVNNGGKEFIIKRATGGNTVTIDTYGSETIDGGSSFSIEHLYEAVTIISDNNNWYLI